ncbi:MAG: hypothetical protein IT182_14495 [Acidobacteria bacterium]|nr:hypothetical protein [Acidobacteriota bacterium]
MTAHLVRAACLVLAIAVPVADARQAPATPQPEQPAPAPQPPATGTQPAQAEPAPPPREGRQPRTSRRSRRDKPAPPRREISDTNAPRSGGPVRETVTFTGNIQAGYDDNLTAGLGSGVGISPRAMASGNTGSADASLAYVRGNTYHQLNLGTSGSVMVYPGYLDGPAAGASANIGGRTAPSRRVTLSGDARLGYEPFFNAFNPGSAGTPLPPDVTPATPATGIFERRTLTSRAGATMETHLGRRDSLSFSYTFGRQSFLDDDTGTDEETPRVAWFGDSTTHTAGASFAHTVSAGLRTRVDYSRAQTSYDGTARDGSRRESRSMRTQRLEGGLDVEHGVDRGRRLVRWNVTGGAAYVQAQTFAERAPYAAWLPVGSASLTVPLSDNTAFEATYRRETNLLQGVTDDVYATDTVSANVTMALGARTSLALHTTYANWQTPTAAGESMGLDVYGAGAQLRVLLSQSVGITASYGYYKHTFSNPAALPAGFPSEYGRNSVRVGLTFMLPLKRPPAPRAARAAMP